VEKGEKQEGSNGGMKEKDRQGGETKGGFKRKSGRELTCGGKIGGAAQSKVVGHTKKKMALQRTA